MNTCGRITVGLAALMFAAIFATAIWRSRRGWFNTWNRQRIEDQARRWRMPV